MSGPNTIDYSNLNKSLQPKRRIDFLKKNTAEEIWKVFISDLKRKSEKEKRLDALSGQIEKWHEYMKIKLALTVDYLSDKELLTADSIIPMKVSKIKWIAWKNEDEKIQSIIDYLIDTWRKDGEKLTTQQKEELVQEVNNWIDKHYWKLAEKDDKSEELKARNDELESELNASEAANEVVESAVLSRRSMNNMIRVWKSIENINNSNLDAETKARKVLRQANTFTIFGSWKRFDLINKLPKKIDVNKEYKEAANNLKEKMNNASKAKEKVAIRYIMRQINTAYKNYIDATNISEETRKQNMMDINTKMAA